MLDLIKKLFCRHVFKGPDLGERDESGMVHWPCSKCGKEFIEPYGYAMISHGKIEGPWGTTK